MPLGEVGSPSLPVGILLPVLVKPRVRERKLISPSLSTDLEGPGLISPPSLDTGVARTKALKEAVAEGLRRVMAKERASSISFIRAMDDPITSRGDNLTFCSVEAGSTGVFSEV